MWNKLHFSWEFHDWNFPHFFPLCVCVCICCLHVHDIWFGALMQWVRVCSILPHCHSLNSNPPQRNSYLLTTKSVYIFVPLSFLLFGWQFLGREGWGRKMKKVRNWCRSKKWGPFAHLCLGPQSKLRHLRLLPEVKKVRNSSHATSTNSSVWLQEREVGLVMTRDNPGKMHFLIVK